MASCWSVGSGCGRECTTAPASWCACTMHVFRADNAWVESGASQCPPLDANGPRLARAHGVAAERLVHQRRKRLRLTLPSDGVAGVGGGGMAFDADVDEEVVVEVATDDSDGGGRLRAGERIVLLLMTSSCVAASLFVIDERWTLGAEVACETILSNSCQNAGGIGRFFWECLLRNSAATFWHIGWCSYFRSSSVPWHMTDAVFAEAKADWTMTMHLAVVSLRAKGGVTCSCRDEELAADMVLWMALCAAMIAETFPTKILVPISRLYLPSWAKHVSHAGNAKWHCATSRSRRIRRVDRRRDEHFALGNGVHPGLQRRFGHCFKRWRGLRWRRS